MTKNAGVIAFEGDIRIAAGDLPSVALAAKKAVTRPHHAPILIFDAETSAPIELDLRGSRDDVLRRLPAAAPAQSEPEAPRGPGRPKLGVVAREVTLLPRHWDWLASQPGGASVALRKLVEQAARANMGKDRIRASQNAAYKFMSVMGGDRPGFEDAARALFAGDAATFGHRTATWPADIREHLEKLAADALSTPTNAGA
ncbi:MAG: DUF2239 family protein [Pseudomonadota bacterium]